jgi:Putative transposase
VLAYLARYTHRVAIANNRRIACDQQGVTFKWKDYRVEGRHRYKQMTLATNEFIRRFLTHVLPKGLHRIRHYGLLAKGACAGNIARARELLADPRTAQSTAAQLKTTVSLQTLIFFGSVWLRLKHCRATTNRSGGEML